MDSIIHLIPNFVYCLEKESALLNYFQPSVYEDRANVHVLVCCALYLLRGNEDETVRIRMSSSIKIYMNFIVSFCVFAFHQIYLEQNKLLVIACALSIRPEVNNILVAISMILSILSNVVIFIDNVCIARRLTLLPSLSTRCSFCLAHTLPVYLFFYITKSLSHPLFSTVSNDSTKQNCSSGFSFFSMKRKQQRFLHYQADRSKHNTWK